MAAENTQDNQLPNSQPSGEMAIPFVSGRFEKDHGGPTDCKLPNYEHRGSPLEAADRQTECDRFQAMLIEGKGFEFG